MTPKAAFAEVQKLGLKVEIIPRTVQDRFVWILGQRVDAEDLFEVLCEVRADPSGTYITDRDQVKLLRDIGVISSTSGSWGTHVSSQKRLDQLITMLRRTLTESGVDYG